MTSHDDYRDRPVRPYVLTGGRAAPSHNTVRPETLLIASETTGRPPLWTSREARALLGMCRELLSLAEAAVHLNLPVSVVMVVASDLVDAGCLTVRADDVPPANRELLEELLNGLRKLC